MSIYQEQAIVVSVFWGFGESSESEVLFYGNDMVG
jgi:hypothetical protein